MTRKELHEVKKKNKEFKDRLQIFDQVIKMSLARFGRMIRGFDMDDVRQEIYIKIYTLSKRRKVDNWVSYGAILIKNYLINLSHREKRRRSFEITLYLKDANFTFEENFLDKILDGYFKKLLNTFFKFYRGGFKKTISHEVLLDYYAGVDLEYISQKYKMSYESIKGIKRNFEEKVYQIAMVAGS